MAKVNVQVAGGAMQEKDAKTIGDLAKLVGAGDFIATVNGEPQSSTYVLQEFEYVAFAKPVKAGK